MFTAKMKIRIFLKTTREDPLRKLELHSVSYSILSLEGREKSSAEKLNIRIGNLKQYSYIMHNATLGKDVPVNLATASI